jgi:putative FmdB family regulatory protein
MQMPIYEYQCEECGAIFEEMQKITSLPLTRCTICNSLQVQRLISHTSFILKGSGWYLTDYVRKPKRPKKAKKPTKDASSRATA